MNAVFVMSSPFPYGEAFSSRARNLTKLLCACGYHVHVIAPKSQGIEESDELKSCDYSVAHIHDPKNIMTLSGIGTAKPYIKAIHEYLSQNTVELIVSGSMVFVADELLKIAKKLKVPYIVEQCEWYDYSTFKFGKWNPYYREHILRIYKKNRKVDGIIAISRLLEQHYSFLGVPVIRIPTILDVASTDYRVKKNDDSDFHIVFAGSLGKGKENIAPILCALTRLGMSKKKIYLDIYGPTEHQIIDNIGGDIELLERVRPYVNIYGRIPQNEVEDKLKDADFTIFIRPIRRSSNAGFPTKLAESMVVGTPVITNDTGDFSLYVKNGDNGILLKDETEVSVINAFELVLSCSNDSYRNMRENARNMAEKHFNCFSYVDEMNEFLARIK